MGSLVAAEPTPIGPHQDRQAAARALASTRRRLFFGATLVSLVVPWAIWATGVSAALWSAFDRVPSFVAIFVYVALTLLVLALVAAPIGYYRGFIVAHRYGLSTQTSGGWLADRIKGTLLGTALMTAACGLFYLLLWAVPAYWWLLFGLAWTGAIVLVTFLAPYVIVPIFFKPRPVEDPALVVLIEGVAQRAGASVAGVDRLDFSRRTHEANAAVIGFGRSRRVVLADTLLDTFTSPEIEAVVAHELGHHVNRDVARLLTGQTVLTFVGLGLAALLGDPILLAVAGVPLAAPAAFPLVLLCAELGGLLMMPLLNAWSRSIEAQADTFAFELLGRGNAFADAMRRLADQNLAEVQPPRWAEILLYSHPAIFRRIARAEAATSV